LFYLFCVVLCCVVVVLIFIKIPFLLRLQIFGQRWKASKW